MVLRTVPNAPPLVLLQNVCECILKLFVRLLVVSRSSNPFKMHHEMESQFSKLPRSPNTRVERIFI